MTSKTRKRRRTAALNRWRKDPWQKRAWRQFRRDTMVSLGYSPGTPWWVLGMAYHWSFSTSAPWRGLGRPEPRW